MIYRTLLIAVVSLSLLGSQTFASPALPTTNNILGSYGEMLTPRELKNIDLTESSQPAAATSPSSKWKKSLCIIGACTAVFAVGASAAYCANQDASSTTNTADTLAFAQTNNSANTSTLALRDDDVFKVKDKIARCSSDFTICKLRCLPSCASINLTHKASKKCDIGKFCASKCSSKYDSCRFNTPDSESASTSEKTPTHPITTLPADDSVTSRAQKMTAASTVVTAAAAGAALFL